MSKMRPEDNLEKYFNKVLNEDSKLSEEDWSIPSDTLWESAKVHFPKKKKKNRFIFLLFGLGLFCLAGIGLYSFLIQNRNSEIAQYSTIKKLGNEPIQEDIKTSHPVTDANLEYRISSIVKDILAKETKKLPKIEQSTILYFEKLDASELPGYLPADSQKPDVSFITKKDRINVIRQEEQVLKAAKNTNKNEPIPTDFKLINKINTKNESNTQKKLEKEQLIIPVSLVKQKRATKIEVLNSLKKPIALLAIRERPIDFKDTLQNLSFPVTPPLKQWEVGLSYAPFIIIQESILNNGLESSAEESTVGVKHQNINFSVRRFLHKRFSVSSGLYLSKGGFDIAFSDMDIYEKSNPTSLKYSLNESDARNELKLSDLGLSIDGSFEYLADANLKQGDVLTVKGGIPIKLKFVQMPLLFNAHFGKRKFKGLVHAGISLDYQYVKVNDITLETFKGTELISKPVVIEPLNEHFLKLRWQAGFGVRYAIKDYLQLGTGIAINISDPILSRYDFGVYYGF